MKDICVALPDWFALSAFLLFCLCSWLLFRRMRGEGIDYLEASLMTVLIAGGFMAIATLATVAMGLVFQSAKAVFGGG